VQLKCAALNPADRYLVQGQYPRAGKPPFTPGRDGSGIIATAAEEGRFRTGDRVCLLGGLTGLSQPGCLAEYCAIPEAWLAPIPEGWTFEEAAAAPLVHLTAWRALVVRGGLCADETVLVTGASGGVGSAAVFLAKSLGARVIALSRSEAKRRALETLGADATVDTTSPTLDQGIRAAVGDRPISLVVENLGGPYLEICLRLTAPFGRVMVVGLLADLTATLTIGLLIHKNLRVEGLSVSNYSADEAHEAWNRILACYVGTDKKPLISKTFALEEVQEAFAHLAAGPLGKVVIRCGA
jgi:NADPH2:quinone reductase